MDKTKKDIPAKIILLVISFVISLIIGEIMVRLFTPRRIENPIDCYAFDKLLDWRLKPNFSKKYTFPEFEIIITTNDKGFRDAKHNYQKPPNVFRIVSIGDSFPFGWGINYEENILSRLYNLLAGKNIFAGDIEMINLAVPSYNLEQYYKALKYEAYNYKPDLVIIFFYTNDWTEKHNSPFKVNKEGFLLTGDGFSFKSLRSFLFPLRIFFKRHFQLYILVREKLSGLLRRYKLMHIPQIEIYKTGYNFSERFSYSFHLLREINNFCKERIGSSLFICIIPETVQVRKSFRDITIKAENIDPRDYDWLQPQKALAQFCAQENILCLDLAQVFTKAEETGRFYFDIDPHWNSQGHMLAAGELYNFILQKQLQKGSVRR